MLVPVESLLSHSIWASSCNDDENQSSTENSSQNRNKSDSSSTQPKTPTKFSTVTTKVSDSHTSTQLAPDNSNLVDDARNVTPRSEPDRQNKNIVSASSLADASSSSVLDSWSTNDVSPTTMTPMMSSILSDTKSIATLTSTNLEYSEENKPSVINNTHSADAGETVRNKSIIFLSCVNHLLRSPSFIQFSFI